MTQRELIHELVEINIDLTDEVTELRDTVKALHEALRHICKKYVPDYKKIKLRSMKI